MAQHVVNTSIAKLDDSETEWSAVIRSANEIFMDRRRNFKENKTFCYRVQRSTGTQYKRFSVLLSRNSSFDHSIHEYVLVVTRLFCVNSGAVSGVF